MMSQYSIRASFNCFQVFVNEEKTRTFLALSLEDNEHLRSLLKKVDNVMDQFKLDRFYADPKLHASLLWCLGDRVQDLEPLVVKLNEDFLALFAKAKMISLAVMDQLHCKIGNRTFGIPLLRS